MTSIADTPKPPYYAVIFTSIHGEGEAGYAEMAERMTELASQQPGFLGLESAQQDLGITVSYWRDLESIQAWRSHAEHQAAQELGKEKWYSDFQVRVCRVERDYSF